MVYSIGKLIVPPIYKLWLRKVEGLENIPKDEPFIIATNHSSYYDALLLPVIIAPKADKKIHALVNSYYWKPFVTRFFLNLWEALPVYVGKEKGAKQKNKKSMEEALKFIKKGELLMIFPEGRRSKDGKLKKAYIGVAKLVLKARTPVLPCGIIGSSKVLPVGKAFPRFTKCNVKIGKLMQFDEYYNKKPNEKIYRQITTKIMKEIAKLIGQTYNH